MKNLILAMVGLAAFYSLTLPAFAVTADEAVATCKKNKNCKITDLETGETSILVNGEIILCPIKGACQCITCKPPKKSVGSKSDNKTDNIIMSVPKLLQQGVAQ